MVQLNCLTTQELRAVRLMAQGMTTKQVADTMLRSLKTIEMYLANARIKAGASNTVRLVLLAERAGLLKDVP